MAPADNLSPPGSASYSSDTMSVGDGTWDFTKNSFLLPNLVGLNFETMRYNGMGNRFSTLEQYHTLILGHGVLAAITFLFIVPFAVLYVRFYTRRPGYGIRYHAYLNILAVLLSTVLFILGFMAVGPSRSLTNPHHGIGVAIYVLILLQVIGGRLVKGITGRSFRVHVHRYSGRAIALLGIVQVPLGLTLYGSPKYCFILYAVWMAFLALLFFILDYRDGGRRSSAGDHRHYVSGGGGGRSESGYTEKPSRMKWLAPIAAGAGIFALMKGRSKKNERARDAERDGSRSPSARSRSRSRREVISSPGQTDTYYDEKSERTNAHHRRASDGGGGGGFMKKALAAGAVGALVGKMMGGRGKKKNTRDYDDSEYSAVATDTPSRYNRPPPRRYAPTESDFTDRTEDIRRHDSRRDRRGSILPPPGDPSAVAAAISAAERPTNRPSTPQRSHAHSRYDSIDGSDYSSYVSPSKRPVEKRKSSGSGMAKGALAALTFGLLGKKAKDSHDRREEERLRDEEDRRREEAERRSGNRHSRYTGDGYGTPTRRESRRRPSRYQPAPSTAFTGETSDLSSIEPRGNTPYEPAHVGGGGPAPAFRPGGPVPVPVPGAPQHAPVPPPPGAPLPIPVPLPGAAGGGGSHPYLADPHGGGISMPPMPNDPQGIFHHDSGSEGYYSAGGAGPSRRPGTRGDPAAAAAAAAASASILAQEQQEEEDRRRRDRSNGPAASVKIQVRDDRDRNITLRRLTEEESRRDQAQRRRRNDSVSSHSEAGDTPTRRYRRDRERDTSIQSSQRRAETAAEQRIEGMEPPLVPPPLSLTPPNPPFAGGKSRPKDSAYYSGQPGLASGSAAAGPSGSVPGAGGSFSSLGGSPGPGPGPRAGDWSALSPTPSGQFGGGGKSGPPTATGPTGSVSASASGDANAAADRRRRRRLERREGSRGAHGAGIPSSVDYD
ncbi:cytochrome b561/ferric reductase transmembrane [Naviculisporaceae sp. PSN 640]